MRTTPPHLQPVLSRVKRFVERMPEGASLTLISQKVYAYNQLQKKDKELLIGIIRESGILCVVGDGRTTTIHHPRFGHQSISSAPDVTPVTEIALSNKTVTPEELRKQAEELIRAAEAAEKKAGDREAMKKQLDPLRLEILQAYGMANRKFDEFVDAMADMGTAIQKLKNLTI